MNVLLDIHHHDLFRSLNLLFHKRFEFNVYLPIGLDWYDQFKYANYYSNQAATEQYLIHVKNWLNVANDLENVRFLTLEEYKDITIDIHVASLDKNIIAFKNSADAYSKKTKHIIQVGNNFDINTLTGNNLLCSSNCVYINSKIPNKVFYHQEFDTKLFNHSKCQNINSVYSYQHYFATGIDPYKKEYDQFLQLKSLASEFDFGCYGNEGDKGSIPNIPKYVSDAIKNTGFVFHVKPQGDGYGHIYHNAFACGRPVIYKSEYLFSENIPMTPMFLFDDYNSIDLSRLSNADAIEKLKAFAKNYDEISRRVYHKFKTVVDFDEQFIKISKFIENLI